MSGKCDCEKLMNTVLPFAEKMLNEYGEFYPFGAYMNPKGEIVQTGAKAEGTDHPKSNDLISLMRDAFSRMAANGTCKATAIVFDVRVVQPGAEEKSDAVQVCLEHADGYSAEVFQPYHIEQLGQVIYDVMFAQEGKHEIF